jgi:hypothetical protein
MTRLSRRVILVLALGATATTGATSSGAVVVHQYTLGYTEGASGDYYVTWEGDLPTITIRAPWNPTYGPYDFDCFR